MSNFKIFSFWQTPSYINSIPPYVLLGLASAKICFKERFILLDDKTVCEYLGDLYKNKDWAFREESDPNRKELMSIVAKSDFLRMAIVNHLGGIWLDADTIVLRDFSNTNLINSESQDLAWYSEQFFGSLPSNDLLKRACDNMISSQYQTWGNPGGIKDIIKEFPDKIKKIPFDLIRLGDFQYNYQNREIMLSNDIDPEIALSNKKQSIIVLYNTPFSQTEYGKMSCAEFLSQDILLSKIFLAINNNKNLWIETAQEIEEKLMKRV